MQDVGIKWGSYTHKEPECDPGLATYTFGTAWDGPYKVFMPKVATRFPSLTFLLSWGGEGPTRGRMRFKGKRTAGKKDEYRDSDYPQYNDEMNAQMEAVWDENYRKVQNAYLTSHPLWVGLTLARRVSFKRNVHPGVLADWIEEEGYPSLAASVRAVDANTVVGPLPK